MFKPKGVMFLALLVVALSSHDGGELYVSHKLPQGAMAQIVQERVNLDIVKQIRDEGLERSHVPELARHLTEVIGPRLTGSPGMRKANEWTAEKLRKWGLTNVQIEEWGEFGRGWGQERYSGQILTPFIQPLHAKPVAWTGSTNGTARGRAVVLSTRSAEDLEQYQGTLRGAWVLLQDPPTVENESEHRPRRISLERLLTPRPLRSRQQPLPTPTRDKVDAFFRRMPGLQQSVHDILREEGASGILTPSFRDHGVLFGPFESGPGRDPDGTIPLPQLVLTREQYNLIHRNVSKGVPVELEINVQNTFYEADLNAYNTLGDIRGTDKAGEYIMIGAHLDSLHWSGGATDNAAGVVIVMEAMRILSSLDLTLRRSIRIALWSGEEQGALGSWAWLVKHPELHDKISVYLNVDAGTGRIRGLRTQGNHEAVAIFEQILFPLRDLGVVTVNTASPFGSDHSSFDLVGIPGFKFLQDPIESYRTRHTSLDTYDHLVVEDLKQAAVVVAAMAYHLAVREEMMPRKEVNNAE
ncbi:MAG: M20/M25/M40 family metallo-hydrolase [Candidatus Aminicenantes bacterium]|nr:MAG: M20/M25/M40 family metallo-hydrolase [Candidatus Aminicenantes bacterium]